MSKTVKKNLLFCDVFDLQQVVATNLAKTLTGQTWTLKVATILFFTGEFFWKSN